MSPLRSMPSSAPATSRSTRRTSSIVKSDMLVSLRSGLRWARGSARRGRGVLADLVEHVGFGRGDAGQLAHPAAELLARHGLAVQLGVGPLGGLDEDLRVAPRAVELVA